MTVAARAKADKERAENPRLAQSVRRPLLTGHLLPATPYICAASLSPKRVASKRAGSPSLAIRQSSVSLRRKLVEELDLQVAAGPQSTWHLGR
jgi:DNA-binding transcriptional LysR family regulator